MLHEHKHSMMIKPTKTGHITVRTYARASLCSQPKFLEMTQEKILLNNKYITLMKIKKKYSKGQKKKELKTCVERNWP